MKTLVSLLIAILFLISCEKEEIIYVEKHDTINHFDTLIKTKDSLITPTSYCFVNLSNHIIVISAYNQEKSLSWEQSIMSKDTSFSISTTDSIMYYSYYSSQQIWSEGIVLSKNKLNIIELH